MSTATPPPGFVGWKARPKNAPARPASLDPLEHNGLSAGGVRRKVLSRLGARHVADEKAAGRLFDHLRFNTVPNLWSVNPHLGAFPRAAAAIPS